MLPFDNIIHDELAKQKIPLLMLRKPLVQHIGVKTVNGVTKLFSKGVMDIVF